MSVESQNEILAALAIANQDAGARIQAASIAAKAEVDAAKATSQTRASADVQVAQIESGWHTTVATTEANAARDVATIGRSAQIDTANIQAAAAEQVAQTEADARRDVALTEAGAAKDVASTNASASRDVALTQAGAAEQVATIDASWHIQVATIEAAASEQVAVTGANAQTTVASTAAAASIEVATIDASWHANVATITGSYEVQTAVAEGGFKVTVSENELTGVEFSATQQLAGVNAHEAGETQRLNIKLDFARNIFTQIEPLIAEIVSAGANALNGTGFQFGFNPARATPPKDARRSGNIGFMRACADWQTTSADTVGSYLRMGDLAPPSDAAMGAGGSTAPQLTAALHVPYIVTRGVFTPAMLQQQVNQVYSRNDARTATAIRNAQGDLAGRGFSSNSPILDALTVGYTTSNLRASVEGASQIRLQSAQANTDAVFRGQEALANLYVQQENVILDAERNEITREVGILNAVASLVGGIL